MLGARAKIDSHKYCNFLVLGFLNQYFVQIQMLCFSLFCRVGTTLPLFSSRGRHVFIKLDLRPSVESSCSGLLVPVMADQRERDDQRSQRHLGEPAEQSPAPGDQAGAEPDSGGGQRLKGSALS